MKLLGLSKPYAIALTGAVGTVLCSFGVSSGENVGSLFLNLGSGFLGAFVTYLLFDIYLGNKESETLAVDQLVTALHGDSLGLKNHLLSRHPKKLKIRNSMLYGANLVKTEWSDLVLINTEFAYCDFSSATFEGCLFVNCAFIGVSFRGSNAAHCKCSNCTFTECDWADSLWPASCFEPALTKLN